MGPHGSDSLKLLHIEEEQIGVNQEEQLRTMSFQEREKT